MSGPAGAAEMSSAQLIQQVALLSWLRSQSETDRGILSAVTAIQVGRELLERFSGQRQVDTFKRQCIMSISQFLRENPRASQDAINAEVEKHVVVFAARVKALEAAPLL